MCPPNSSSTLAKLRLLLEIQNHHPKNEACSSSSSSSRKRPRVSFSNLNNNDTRASTTTSTTTTSSSSSNCHPLSIITEQDAQSLWYQKDEITCFKLEARRYIFGQQQKHQQQQVEEEQQEEEEEEIMTTTTRGFERYDIDRVTNKALALKCTLLAAKEYGLRGDELALLSKHCTLSARRQAFWTACEDYCCVYNNNNNDDNNNNNNNNNIATTTTTKKRSFSTSSSSSDTTDTTNCRRVRIKTC